MLVIMHSHAFRLPNLERAPVNPLYSRRSQLALGLSESDLRQKFQNEIMCSILRLLINAARNQFR